MQLNDLLGLDINDLINVRDTLKAEHSLHEFFKQAWPHIEGDKPFVDGWHLHAICEHLEAVAKRDIKNLLINIPPRCGKSSLISITFPAWVWLHAPNEQFLYASYALSLALRDSVKCRRLILSPWYKERWRDSYQLVGDQNTKGRFDNTKKGYRIASSVGSSVTGEGGSILIIDDGNNALDAVSEVKRDSKVDWWSNVWSTRLNDKQNDCRIVVQQRVHERDITGFILDHDDLNEWVKLILPMEFETNRVAHTVILPSTNGKAWRDPRTEEGQLLWPERIDEKALASIKQALGSEYAIAGQLQQRPSPEVGGIIKKTWFSWWKQKTPPPIEFVIQSWDTAVTVNDTSSYSACTTWGVFYDENHIANVILLSSWRGRVEYPELREIATRLYKDYRDTGKEHDARFAGTRIDMCLIESKTVGDPLIFDLQRAGIKAIGFNPNKYGDKYSKGKLARVRLITTILEQGQVWVPARAPNYDSLLSFADKFVESVARFPNTESNDLVDTMTQMLLKLREQQFIVNTKDPVYVEQYKQPVDLYF